MEVLSCFLVPKGKKYNEDYDIVEVHKAIREHLSIPHCLALSGFFLTKFVSLMRGMLIFSRVTTRLTMKGKQKKEMLTRIEKLMQELPNGLGLAALMQ